MKKILIIYPHFPPSNLAGVHRPRLFANHLRSFGWEPVILTVHEKYYEENLDPNLEKLLPTHLRIEKVTAFTVGSLRIIGDIGLRAFFQLYQKANHLIKKEGFDFIYIPIPSFYVALLGRWLHYSTGVKYGIDYIDPWVHQFPGSDKLFSRHWFSSKLARILEPIAIKKASMITGVAEGYYFDVLKRNPHLQRKAVYGAMPYGGEINDHRAISELNSKPYLFCRKQNKITLVYAGAMLPKAFGPLEAIFRSVNSNPDLFKDVEIHFIGTGKFANSPDSYNIKPLAEKYKLWGSTVYEYPARIPYLDVLIHLEEASAIFILGSTEPHYTPSKTYQGVLSRKPLFAILHEQSTAVSVIRRSGAGIVLDFNGESDLSKIQEHFAESFIKFKDFAMNFNDSQVNMEEFEQYSAFNVTKKLAEMLDMAMSIKSE